MGREVRPEIEESGTRLATFTRKGFARDNKPDVELRVTLDEYEGKAFVQVRQWEMAYGRMVPTKRGTSIRLSEVPGVIQALEGALLEADAGKKVAERGDDMPPQRQLREPRGPRRDQPPTRRAPWQPAPHERSQAYRSNPVANRLPMSGSGEFNELDAEGDDR